MQSVTFLACFLCCATRRMAPRGETLPHRHPPGRSAVSTAQSLRYQEGGVAEEPGSASEEAIRQMADYLLAGPCDHRHSCRLASSMSLREHTAREELSCAQAGLWRREEGKGVRPAWMRPPGAQGSRLIDSQGDLHLVRDAGTGCRHCHRAGRRRVATLSTTNG